MQCANSSSAAIVSQRCRDSAISQSAHSESADDIDESDSHRACESKCQSCQSALGDTGGSSTVQFVLVVLQCATGNDSGNDSDSDNMVIMALTKPSEGGLCNVPDLQRR
eukprot:3758020-Amphidinium_carterae.1